MGIGVVIQDSSEEVLACLSFIVNRVHKPIIADTLALRRAWYLCVELGLSNVILEGNSHIIVKAINSDEEVWTDYGNIVKDVILLLVDRVDGNIRIVYSEANEITHKLIKLKFTFYKENGMDWS